MTETESNQRTQNVSSGQTADALVVVKYIRKWGRDQAQFVAGLDPRRLVLQIY